jgi:selenocysteine-specific elongation factor
MIVATAGHVDHGKTSLIRALTQIDTDRLAEEKRRGMSIDLGFAYADFGVSAPIGFVDVPGHERFVRNMLAGVAAIDCALLVIAADDGPMPQTIEHLAILELLGVQQAIVALTKIDRVDEARRAQAAQEIRTLLANTSMRDALIFPLVASTGEGVEALRESLTDLAKQIEAKAALVNSSQQPAGNFRLSIDRAFVLPGAGLVVSGAVYAGRAQVGDRVVVSPEGVEARIRSIHAQNQSSQFALAGQRCALNLSGPNLNKETVGRGAWVLAEQIHAPTQRLDVELTLLASEARALVDGATVQLHLGAASMSARVALLRTKTLVAGQRGWAQLVLDRPIATLQGDRFVLRDQAAQRTIGGGRVIDPFGLIRGRAKEGRLLELAAMSAATAHEALIGMLDLKSDGLDLQQFECAWNLNQAQQAQLRALPGLRLIAHKKRDLALAESKWQALRKLLLEAIAQHHASHADSLGLSESALIAIVSRNTIIASAVLRSLLEEQVIIRDGLVIRDPNHLARMNEKDQLLFEKISIVLLANGLRPPIVLELAKALEIDPSMLLAFLQRASQGGHLAAVASNRFYLLSTIADLVGIAGELAAQSPESGFDAGAYRDRSGIGRNSTIQVLEYFDRHGFTRFAGNRRWMTETYARIST